MKIDPTKHYEILVDLYKHYNQILLKSSTVVYAVISGLVVFYLTNKNVENIIILKYLAGIVTALSSILFFFLSYQIKNVQYEMSKVAGELELMHFPSIQPMYWFLRVNSISLLIMLVVGFKYLL